MKVLFLIYSLFQFCRGFKNDPYNLRFAVALQNSDGLSISWTTQELYDNEPFIEYGTNKNDLNLISRGTSIQYHNNSVHHHVITNTLSQSTRYFFKICNSPRIDSFISPKTSFPLKIAIYGDMGIENSNNTIHSLKNKDLDLFLHIGDISYADDRGYEIGNNPEYEDVYDSFLSAVNIFSNNRPYMVAPGNHDISCHSVSDIGCDENLRNFTAFNSRFRMPSDESGGIKNLWYSFDFGPVHFISINTESDYPGSPVSPNSFFFVPKAGGFGDQIEWLESDLQKVNRRKTPWIIVYGHRPMYNQLLTDWPLTTKSNIKKVFEPLFHKYNVDIYFAGHVHANERNAKILNGKKNENGIYHITIGSPGCIEKIDTSHLLHNYYNEYSNYKDYGYGEITIYNQSVIQWNFISSDNDEILDTKYYIK